MDVSAQENVGELSSSIGRGPEALLVRCGFGYNVEQNIFCVFVLSYHSEIRAFVQRGS